MKKVSLLLLTALLLFTTACSGGGSGLIPAGQPIDNTYHVDTDAPYQLKGDRMFYVAALNRYYFFAGEFLMYTDAQTMQPQMACTREGCAHNQTDTSEEIMPCQAWLPSSYLVDLTCYEDRVYLTLGNQETGPYRLVSIEPDGSEYKEELRIEIVRNHAEPGGQCFHRGRLYYIWENTDDDGHMTIQLWTYPLGGTDHEPQLLYQTEQPQPVMDPLYGLTAYGNYLYLLERTTVLETITSGTATAMITDNVLRILDLTTAEWTTQEVPEGYTISQADTVEFAEGKLMTRYTTIASLREDTLRMAEELAQTGSFTTRPLDTLICRSELDGSGVQTVEDYQWAQLSQDGYVYEVNADASAPQDVVLHIVDPDGNIVYELLYEEIFGRTVEVNGESHEVMVVYANCALRLLPGEKLALETHEMVMWEGGELPAFREGYYMLDYADVATGTAELQELFCFDEIAYSVR